MSFSHKRYELDVADIWSEEIESFKNGEQPKKYYDDLYHFLKTFYLKNGHKPFISAGEVQADPSKLAYYNNHFERLKVAEYYPVDFFEHGDAFYDMYQPCIISRTNVTKSEFIKLFALRLNQFKKKQYEIGNFLEYQLASNFSDDITEFGSFLSSLIQQNKAWLHKDIMQFVNEWINVIIGGGKSITDVTIEEEYDYWNPFFQRDVDDYERNTLTSDDKHDADHFSENSEAVYDQTLLASEDQVIPGDFSQEEIMHYFSFLHSIDPATNLSFLSEDEVKAIFKKGITIPAFPLKTKYTLNSNQRFPKKIVDYFIHQFYIHYNRNEKENILRFFGSYISNYAAALYPETMKNLKSNMTGEKPASKKFRLENYLPARLQKQ